MSFWKRPAKTSGPEHEKAVSKTSDQWADELARLRSQSDQLAVEEATVTAEAGRARLDGQTARASDLTRRLTEIASERAVLASAITAAQDRQSDAARDEERKRLTRTFRGHTALIPTHFEMTARVRELENELAQAVRSRAAAVDREHLETLYRTLLNAGGSISLTPKRPPDGVAPESSRREPHDHNGLSGPLPRVTLMHVRWCGWPSWYNAQPRLIFDQRD